MIISPSHQQEGVDAAVAGTRMSSFEMPMGFTFCPYHDGSVEKWNFIQGAVNAYFGEHV